MLGIEGRAARYTWTVALVALLLWVVYQVRKTLFVFVLALLLAHLLEPLVDLLDRVLLKRTRTRTPALALAYVLFIGLVVLAGYQIGTRVAAQANTLAAQFPALMEKWQHPAVGSGGLQALRRQVVESIAREIAASGQQILAAGGKFLTLASDVVYVVVIPILAFFFLKDVRPLREGVLAAIEDGPRRAMLVNLMADAHLLLVKYMRALMILSAATFVAYSIGLTVIGVPYTILLAGVAGLLEVIPMIGPLTAGVLITLMTLASGGHVLAVLLFMGIYRVFQDYVLAPQVMGQGVAMHPLLVLFGVFAGAEIAGIPGAFLSVPVLALLRILFVRYRALRPGGAPPAR